jgi:hypothetical protein
MEEKEVNVKEMVDVAINWWLKIIADTGYNLTDEQRQIFISELTKQLNERLNDYGASILYYDSVSTTVSNNILKNCLRKANINEYILRNFNERMLITKKYITVHPDFENTNDNKIYKIYPTYEVIERAIRLK